MTSSITLEQVKAAVVTFSNGDTVINTTPHELTFLDGEEVKTVPVSGILINGKPVETFSHMMGKSKMVKTIFEGNQEGREAIARIRQEARNEGIDNILIVGSIIAAQAYPGDVVAMIPAPGFERVPPDQKRMMVDKFTIF